MNSAVEKELYLGKNPDKEREKRRERERGFLGMCSPPEHMSQKFQF